MRSRAVAALVLACMAAVAAVAAAAAADERSLAFTLNVEPLGVVAVVQPGQEACQRGVDTEGQFDVVQALLGTLSRPGPRLAVTVRDASTGQTLATGDLPGGAADNQAASVRVEPAVTRGRWIDVCFRNDGSYRVALYGGPVWHAPSSDASLGGRPAGGDLQLSFYRSRPRTALALLPDMLQRAALFRPDPIGVWTFWALLAGMAVAMPLLLAVALRRALSTDRGAVARDEPGIK